MSQKISWFIESDGKIQRVEEDLVSISDKELSFARKKDKFILKSEVSIAPYVFGDVVFMIQQASDLIPIRLPFISEDALLSQEEIDQLVKSQVSDLEQKVEENREVIKRLLQEKPESMSLLYRIFDKFSEFREYLHEKAGEIVEEKVEQQKQLIEAKQAAEVPPLSPPVTPAPIPVTTSPQTETPKVISAPPPPAIPAQPSTPPTPPPPPPDTSYSEQGSSYRMFFNQGGKKRWT